MSQLSSISSSHSDSLPQIISEDGKISNVPAPQPPASLNNATNSRRLVCTLLYAYSLTNEQTFAFASTLHAHVHA
jgi:hypothetical protein